MSVVFLFVVCFVTHEGDAPSGKVREHASIMPC